MEKKQTPHAKAYTYTRCFRTALLLIFLLMGITSVYAQDQKAGSLTGTIKDATSGDILPGANVYLQGTSLGSATSFDGEYVIRNIPAGDYSMIVRYIGYKEKVLPVTVKPGVTMEVNIKLEYAAIESEEITITAQALGQVEAINQQLSSNTITSVVSAARIQDVPDANAAESVGRLPGVSIVRSGGEGQKITIRGMEPKYNVVMVNGVRMESTDRDDRSVDLNMISPNILSGIEVTKALTADMDADAVGGTVNLKISKAREGFHLNVSAQDGYGSVAGTYGNYKFSGLVSNRYFNNKLGVQLSGYMDKFDRSYDQLSATYATNDSETNEEGLRELYLASASIVDVVTERKRKGGSLVFDYELPFGTIMLNNFISSIHQETTTQQNALTLEEYTWSGYANNSENTNTVISNSLQGEFNFFDFLDVDFTIANSMTRQRYPGTLTMSIGPKSGAGNMWADDLDKDISATPSELLNAYYMTGETDIVMQKFYTLQRKVNESAQTAELNLKMPFNFTDYLAGSIKFGGKYIRNTRKSDETQWSLSLNKSVASETFLPLLRDSLWTDLGIEEDEGSFLMASLLEDTNYDIGNFLSGKEGVSSDIFYNKLSISKMHHLEDLAKSATFVSSIDGETYSYYFYDAQASTQYDYNYTRNFDAFYVMGEINVGKYLTFVPGIRYEKYHYLYDADSTFETASQTVLGYQSYSSTEVHCDSSKAETWFPQMQVRIKPTDWLDIRLASTKSIIYPDYRAVSPYIYISTASTPQSLELGNPYLKPATTQNYDIYASVYENSIGLFTAGFFYKEIDGLITPITYLTKDASVINYRMNLSTSAKTEIDTWANLEQTSYVRGFELDWQTHFWYLPSFLSGAVFNINYTHIKSESYYPFYKTKSVGMFGSTTVDTTRSCRMADQPNDILNATLGYDLGGFSARLSFLYQGNTLISVDSYQPELDLYTDAYYRWDFTAYYKLPWYEGLQVYANVNNITDRPDRQFRSTMEKLSYVQYYGRTVDLGVRYQF